MNPKIAKIDDEIAKTKAKITELQARLREMEQKKTGLENADIVAAVRAIDIPPDELADYVKAYMESKGRADGPASAGITPKSDEEDSSIEN